MKRVLAFVFLSLILAVPSFAQTTVATGLLAPNKVIITPRGNLLVVESGNGANTGRISLVDRISGERRTIISGLPSGVDAEGETSGPSGVVVRGNTLYVLIAEGDAVVPGPVQGAEAANPTPSSPLLSSILRVDLSAPIDDFVGTLSMTPQDHDALANGQSVNLGSESHAATFSMLTNFHNFRAEPRPDFPQNVRASDPYGLTILGDSLYVADAGWNAIQKVSLSDGTTTILTEFPPVANPTHVGPPVVDAVPDNIRTDGTRLIVPLLTGFPFATGVSSVVAVDPSSGAVTPLITNLTTAIDAAPIDPSHFGTGFVVAQFSSNLNAGAPGRIDLMNTTGDDNVITDSIISPTSVAVDQRTREVFVTQIFPGTLVRLDATQQLPPGSATSIIPIIGSVGGAYGTRFETSLQLTNPQPYPVSGVLTVRGMGVTATLPYQLAPRETRGYANIWNEFNVGGGAAPHLPDGIASLDIDAGVGPVPRVIAHIYETTHNAGSTGALIDQVAATDAIYEGQTAILVSSITPGLTRTNIGVRNLGPVRSIVSFFLFHQDGTAGPNVKRTYTGDQVAQESLDSLFGSAAQPNDSVLVSVEAGAIIPFVSVVDNGSQQIGWQRGVRVAE